MLMQFLKKFTLEKIAVLYVNHSQWRELFESLYNEISEDESFPEIDLVYKKVFHNSSEDNLDIFLNYTRRRAKGKLFSRLY